MASTESAMSAANATILMIAVTTILAALVLLLLTGMPGQLSDLSTPVIFQITDIRHVNEHGILNHESFMTVTNIGERSFDNRKLYARTYRNGKLLACFIPTLNGYDFIQVHPYGIQTLGGPGTYNYQWLPEKEVYIDYSQGTFRPGDSVQFEVYDRDTGRVISRDSWPHSTSNTEKWMKLLF